MAAYIHGKICKKCHVQTADKWYEHNPKTVEEKDDITILYDMPIHREISGNRPDIIIKNNRDKKCIVIDVAIPSDKNTSTKVSEKMSKYKDLEIEITRMWQIKREIIPVVIGALRVIKKGEIPGNINLQEIQKTALLGTAHILPKVLSIK